MATRRIRWRRWGATLVAMVISTYALDLVAAATGLLLVASNLLDSFDRTSLLVLLGVSYLAWGWGMGTNLKANWTLLETTGTSTNLASKAAFDLVGRRTTNIRTRRLAAAIGYVGTEVVKEAPYYLGAFLTVVVTETITAADALIFLAGANMGAAIYEFGLGRLTIAYLTFRRVRQSGEADPATAIAEAGRPSSA